MKKMYLALSAAILAIGFSAFTTSPQQTAQFEEELFWYPVNPSTNEINSSALINSVKKTKSQLRTDSQIPCPEVAGDDCIRGFAMEQSSNHDLPGLDYTTRAD